jgi:hypothetical protein
LQLALLLLAMAGMLPNGTLPAISCCAALARVRGSQSWRPLRPFVVRIEFGKAVHGK